MSQSSSSSSIHVIIPQEGEAWSALTQRLLDSEGEVLLILAGRESDLMERTDARKELFTACKKLQQRLRIATKHPVVAADARGNGIRVLDRTKHLRALLHGHPKLNDAMQVFSPHQWKQQLKSSMQRMGLLSVPKLRIFSLVGLSAIVFFFVIFRLLPSAEVRVKPRQQAVSQTVNIFLVQSGTTLDVSEHVRRMPLVTLNVKHRKQLNFDHISKEFIGTSAQMALTVINKSAEDYSLRTGTRFTNQAGMIFKILDPAIMEPGEEVTVRAKADDLDLYGEIMGDRGNVPKGLKWDIPGLSVEERAFVYAENREPAKGGTTAFRTVLSEGDIVVARKRLEQELLAAAKQMVEEEKVKRNEQNTDQKLIILNYADLTSMTFSGFILPTQFLGQQVTSVPIEGSIDYTIFAYDAEQILKMLRTELQSHVREGRRLMDADLTYEDLVSHLIAWDDAFSWVKLTVDLTAVEEYILDPLSPTGAIFGKKIREQIIGMPIQDALRIVKNMPEVETVAISQWPPWQRSLPRIGAHISIIPE